MIDKIISFLKKESVKYIIIGGITAISLSIVFAFFANKIIVFSSAFDSLKKTIGELMSFVGGRIITLIIEMAGVWFLVSILSFNEYLSKIFINIIVLILNYIISKFFVFK